MATNNYRKITHNQLPGSSEKRSDIAGEVAANKQESRPVYATKIIEIDDELVYGEDVAFLERYVHRDVVTDEEERFSWTRFECSLKQPWKGIKQNSSLIIADYPFANAWVQDLRLRTAPIPSSKRPDVLENCSNLWDAVHIAESFPFDFWETSNRMLVGGVSLPNRVYTNTSKRSYLRAENVTAPKMFLGWCADIDYCRTKLLNSVYLNGIVEKVYSNEHSFIPGNNTTVKPYLPESGLAKVNDLFELSVLQALAGPDHVVDPSGKSKAEGSLVELRVVRILNGHLSLLLKTIMGKEVYISGSSTEDSKETDRDPSVLNERLHSDAQGMTMAEHLESRDPCDVLLREESQD